jgi:phage repressor protein C with HTH and peptisase S24 domain
MTDTRPDFAQRLEEARTKRGFKSAKDAATFFGWKYDSYIQHERGERGIKKVADKYAKAFRVSAAWLLTGEGAADRKSIPIMGFVGAGAEIMPEFEQVPPEGLGTIDLPFNVPDGIIAFEVRGISMLPVFKDGDAILVHESQRLATENYVGEDIACRTHDGRRFLKELQYGRRRGMFNLHSHNAPLIEDVQIEWVGEIYLIVKGQQIRRIRADQSRVATKRRIRIDDETDGMDELPLKSG